MQVRKPALAALMTVGVALWVQTGVMPARAGEPAVETVTPTPEATAGTVAPVATQKTDSSPAKEPGSILIRLVEDTNRNSMKDEADTVPAQTEVFLVPWVEPKNVIELITAKDGTFQFANLPAGDYTLRLFWPAGFVDGLGSPPGVPHLLRAVFRVNDDGSLGVPDPLPDTWPGLPEEKFDPANDGALLGDIPAEILLVAKDPETASILPDAGEQVYAFGEGSIDVGKALRQGFGSPELPVAGNARGGSTTRPEAIGSMLAVATLLVVAALLIRGRRAGRGSSQ